MWSPTTIARSWWTGSPPDGLFCLEACDRHVNLAFMWRSFEPVEHHFSDAAWSAGGVHCFSVVLPLVSSCSYLRSDVQTLQDSRIGTGSCNWRRGDVLMPEHDDLTVSYLLIRIKEPNTRFRCFAMKIRRRRSNSLTWSPSSAWGFLSLRCWRPSDEMSLGQKGWKGRFEKHQERLWSCRWRELSKVPSLWRLRASSQVVLLGWMRQCEDVESHWFQKGMMAQDKGSWNATSKNSKASTAPQRSPWGS